MIKEFVDRFMENRHKLEEQFQQAHPDDYLQIVRMVVEVIGGDYAQPDPRNIHEIGRDGYQGTAVYVIAEKGFMPELYWAVKVNYGSCSGCDTLEGIRDHYPEKRTKEQQVKDYMMLALHIVQEIKEI